MRNSLRGRLLLSYLALVTITICTIAVALAAILLNSPVSQTQTYRHLADIARANRLYVSSATPEQVDQRLAEIAADNMVRVIRLGDNNLVEFDTASLLEQGAEPNLRTALGSQASDNVQRGLLTDVSGKEWLVVSLRPRLQGLVSSRILVATERSNTRLLSGIFDDLTVPMLQASLVGAFLSILFALIISNWIIQPLNQVADAARVIEAGDYSQGAPESGPAEVRSMAHAFNSMVQQVRKSREMQRSFLANVSHELKTPLTSIQGFAQAIVDATAADPAAAGKVIFEEAGRMRRLVEDLLDLAKIESGQVTFQRHKINLNELIQIVAGRFQLRMAEHQVSLKVQPGEAPTITGDADRLSQVITNLLDNALIHTPPGGQITIATSRNVNYMEIEVSDTGEGIPPDATDRIFERFYQADKSRSRSSRPGSGLGLTISKEIVLAHGGNIGVKSNSKEGTTFSVMLPLPGSSDETATSHRRN
jgi:signal transduction histidine kinase